MTSSAKVHFESIGLSFSASKSDPSVWTSWPFLFCQSEFIPSRVKTFKVCHSLKLKSQVQKWMINRFHSVAPLCPYSLSVCTCLCACWKSRGIHYSTLPGGWPSAAPHKSTDVRLHRFTLSASPSLLRQQAHVSLSAGHSWAIQTGTPSPSTPPRGPWGHPQARRAGLAWASRGVERRGTMSGGERLMKEQKLSPD